MENEHEEITDYTFLKENAVEKYFADLNIKLLSGRHIQNNEFGIFSVLEDYYEPLKGFYQQLYKLDLVKDQFDQAVYYYLNFFDTSKGKLSDQSRYRTLTEMQTITGLMLLDMYYTKYFDEVKVIQWIDIQYEIKDGDHKANYQRILFSEIRESYTENEWMQAEKKFKDAINSFDKLGWVNRHSGAQEELKFEINPCIHRIARLYEKELEDFDAFALTIKPEEEI
ncbi:MAG TPA: hypothetical protein DCO83_11510 [Mucilaginibacter sp.]|jgi:chromosome condensin MukBEF MukE localization factor|nr:hypothetical protein [Mucilaginibacter sp.]